MIVLPQSLKDFILKYQEATDLGFVPINLNSAGRLQMLMVLATSSQSSGFSTHLQNNEPQS